VLILQGICFIKNITGDENCLLGSFSILLRNGDNFNSELRKQTVKEEILSYICYFRYLINSVQGAVT
jgi:hypothetical protein